MKPGVGQFRRPSGARSALENCSPGPILEALDGLCATGATIAARSDMQLIECASGLAGAGLMGCCGGCGIRALNDGPKGLKRWQKVA
jgi:hypothetical protein